MGRGSRFTVSNWDSFFTKERMNSLTSFDLSSVRAAIYVLNISASSIKEDRHCVPGDPKRIDDERWSSLKYLIQSPLFGVEFCS